MVVLKVRENEEAVRDLGESKAWESAVCQAEMLAA